VSVFISSVSPEFFLPLLLKEAIVLLLFKEQHAIGRFGFVCSLDFVRPHRL